MYNIIMKICKILKCLKPRKNTSNFFVSDKSWISYITVKNVIYFKAKMFSQKNVQSKEYQQ